MQKSTLCPPGGFGAKKHRRGHAARIVSVNIKKFLGV
jgi:hypothetical protein